MRISLKSATNTTPIPTHIDRAAAFPDDAALAANRFAASCFNASRFAASHLTASDFNALPDHGDGASYPPRLTHSAGTAATWWSTAGMVADETAGLRLKANRNAATIA
jgi:hypothetical protein